MTHPSFKPIAIIGAGSWGTALAMYLSRQGQTVQIWSIETAEITAMQKEHANTRYLPGFSLSPLIHPMLALSDVLHNVDDIIIAVPSVGFRSTLAQLKPLLHRHHRLLCVTKGLDTDSGTLLHEVVHDILGNDFPHATLSGPSFAREVAAGMPTAVMIASHDKQFAQDLKQRFNSPLFHIDLSEDVIGVELGGVIKNVIAIATGIFDGMKLGTNARSALITRGLAEMMQLGVHLGGQQKTFMGLAGLGDLILTCSDDQSRNRRLGLALGQGRALQEAEKEIGQAIEGKRNAELVTQLAKKHVIAMPICDMVWYVLQGKSSAAEAVETLLAQMAK